MVKSGNFPYNLMSLNGKFHSFYCFKHETGIIPIKFPPIFFLTLHLCPKSELFTSLNISRLTGPSLKHTPSYLSHKMNSLPFSRDVSRRWLPLTDTAPEPGWILHGVQLEGTGAAARPLYLTQLPLRTTLKFAPNKTKGESLLLLTLFWT